MEKYTIGVIGTAGRKEDIHKLNFNLYTKMYSVLKYEITLHLEEMFNPCEIHLVSGGAAWADHLAVRAFNNGLAQGLILHFPCNFNGTEFVSSDRTGSIANYYHKLMSNKLGINSLEDIKIAIQNGAQWTVGKGFYDRNIQIGKAATLLAFTFGQKNYFGLKCSAEEAGLKDGGTAHTWNNSFAIRFRHCNLNNL